MNGDHWVSANKARDKLKAATGKGPEVLIAWASNGLLRAHAEAWLRDWREAEKDVNLPIEFWLGTPVSENGATLDAFSPSDWDSNIFRAMVSESGARRYVEGEPPYRHTAHFVAFSAEDLTKCIAGLKKNANTKPKENKPRLPDAALNAWFANLGSNADKISQDELLLLCLAAHPNNSIARDRIRVKTQGRTRGPKPKSR